MSMVTLIKMSDLIEVQHHLDEFSIYNDSYIIDDVTVTERNLRINYKGFCALGDVSGANDQSTVSFSTSNREAIWEICARVGIPFRFF
jgi:hypothetical protein